MLPEYSFTEARSKLTTIIDYVQNLGPQIIRKRKKTETDILLIDVEHLKDMLAHLSFCPEIVQEEDGSVTLSLENLELFVNQPTLEEAYQELANDLLEYANEYMDNQTMYLKALNRKSNYPYIIRVKLCQDQQEIMGLLIDGKNSPEGTT